MLEFSDDESAPFTPSEMLQTLYDVYEFESPRVAGPHGGAPGFNPWSKEEFLDAVPVDTGLLDKLLELLDEKGHLLKVPAGSDPHERFLTRTAEIVRTIGSIHEYVGRETDTEGSEEEDTRTHLQIIEATKWVPHKSERPRRDLKIDDFIAELRGDLEARSVTIVRGRAMREVVEITELALMAIARVVVPKDHGSFRLTRFQGRAIKRSLIASWTGQDDSAIIICAGTSSGKTIGFAVPVLVDAVIDSLESERPRWNQLMLYPRNDLAFDQYSTLRKYCGELNKQIFSKYGESACITIALDASGFIKNRNEKIPGIPDPWDHKDWDQKGINVVNASSSRYGGTWPTSSNDVRPYRPASIMIASTESFRRRMVQPAVSRAVRESLGRVVLDEIHLAQGIQGGHLRGLFDRLMALRGGSRPLFIAASATIAEPKSHVQRVWGSPRADDVEQIEPTESEKGDEVSGIVNHVLVRPRTGVTKGGPVYNTTSLVGHQTRRKREGDADWVSAREGSENDLGALDKMLCFADSREFVGRWQMIMNENEGGMNAQRIRPLQLDAGKKRTAAIRLPYAHWFDRPLAQQLGHDKVCTSCKKGVKLDTPAEDRTISSDLIREFRTKWGGDSEPEPFAMEGWKPDQDGNIEVNGLDECPHMHAGTCWWFSQGVGDKPLTESNHMAAIADFTIPRPNDPSHKVFRNKLRFRRHTAETGRGNQADGLSLDESQFSADSLYVHSSGEAYPAARPSDYGGPEIVHDAIIATPTLEVGVDMENVGTVVTHRAMRNASSYRQKAGRAGRENNSVATVVTVLSRRPGDYQFYRDEQRLIVDEILDTVPVANENQMVMRAQAYMCALDWVCAMKGRKIESIGSHSWEDDLQAAANDLRDREDEVVEWIYKGFRYSCIDFSDVRNAVRTLARHLTLIALGEYTTNEGGTKTRVLLRDEIRRANGLRRTSRHGGDWNAKIAKPSTAPGMLDGTFLSACRTHHSKCKPFLEDDISEEIGSLLDRLFQWFQDPDESIEKWCDEIEEVQGKLGRPSVRTERMAQMSLEHALNQLFEQIEGYEHSEEVSSDTANELAQQLYRTKNKTSYFYLSWLLGECEVFLKDAPYCYVEKSFINPHEERINVTIPGARRETKQDIRQFMRDLLPGTWTFRLATSGGGHALKSPVGGDGTKHGRFGLEGMWTVNLAMKEQAQPGDEVGVDGYNLSVKPAAGGAFDLDAKREVPWMVSMRHDQKNVKIVSPKFLYMHYENGKREGNDSNTPSKVWYGATDGRVAFMDRKVEGPDVDKSGLIPESWPSRWVISNPRSTEKLLSYSPSTMYKKDNASEGEAGLHSVTHHPLHKPLFSSIEFSHTVGVRDVVLGIHRSRGIAIRYLLDDEEDAVFGRIIETQGIQYTVSDHVIEEFDRRSEGWRDLPFDMDAMRMLQHHLERTEVSPDTERFSNKHMVNTLLLQLHLSDESELPATLGEAADLLSSEPVAPEIVTEYLEGIQPHVRDLVSDGLVPLVETYHERGEEFWESDEIEESIREWHRYTFLNTLGKVMIEAASGFTGVEEDRIGYSIQDGLLGGPMGLTLFDDDSAGNGCCQAIRRHYQISDPSREAHGEMHAGPLPDRDFITELEKRMMTCDEHIENRLAIDLHCGRDVPTEFMDKEHGERAESLRSRFAGVWGDLNIRTVRRAEMLKEITSVLRNRVPAFEAKSVDELEQALHVCCTGCFICQGAPRATALPSPALAERYSSKALLDSIFAPTPDSDGYGNDDSMAEASRSPLGGLEVFPNYKQPYDQKFPFIVQPLPTMASEGECWVPRDGVQPLPRPIILWRSMDHLGVYD